jgi:hypothetical protein
MPTPPSPSLQTYQILNEAVEKLSKVDGVDGDIVDWVARALSVVWEDFDESEIAQIEEMYEAAKEEQTT